MVWICCVSVMLLLTALPAQEKEKPGNGAGESTRKVPVAVCSKCGHWEVGTAPLKCPECKATRDRFRDEERNVRVGPELAPNYGFEKGKGSPEGWDEVDDLSSYWVERPGGGGKCLKFDSDVYPEDVDARAEEMKLPAGKRPRAKPKKPTSGPKYDTIAGTRGALLWSEYIEVEPGANYLLCVEVNTYAPETKVFIKGYAEVKGERRIGYKVGGAAFGATLGCLTTRSVLGGLAVTTSSPSDIASTSKGGGPRPPLNTSDDEKMGSPSASGVSVAP